MKINLAPDANSNYLPEIFDLNHPASKAGFELLVANRPGILMLDHYDIQKKELIKTRHPGKPLPASEIESLYVRSLEGKDMAYHGVWVYYSWLNKLVHILDHDEFVELRTNRNHHKITRREQDYLATKTLGIIGLSVGHAVAVCMATERICGNMKLADFDSIELSNLNRIKTSITNIGLNKAIVTAREIAEIDPFIRVECFTEGITNENLDAFLLENGKLDILIDECDGIDVKIQSRQAAKQHGIPVVMETSDKGMLDVERFDLEKERPVLHGLLNGLPLENLKNLTTEQKIPLILKIADPLKGSVRGKASMLEVGQSISTWPQLASAVTLGGAVVTDVCRRILLDEFHESGRYYVDIESIAGDTPNAQEKNDNPFKPFSEKLALSLIDENFETASGTETPTEEELTQMIASANLAPSTGNDQPWKWIFAKGRLFLFHDEYRSFSFGDFDRIASDITFGGAYENLRLKAFQLGYTLGCDLYPLGNHQSIVAAVEFYKKDSGKYPAPYMPALVDAIPSRITNRNASQPAPIPPESVALLEKAAESVKGARLQWITSKETMLAVGKIIGECDRVRLLNPQGHTDFVHREMRWTPDHANESRDGIDIRTLGISGPLTAALSIMKDARVASVLKNVDGGRALVDAAIKTVSTASMLGVITIPGYSRKSFFAGGRSMERLWLMATRLGYAVHPLISPFYLFPRVTKGNGEGLDAAEVNKLKNLRKEFKQVITLNDEDAEIFIFKIAIAEAPLIKTLRLPVHETLYVAKD